MLTLAGTLRFKSVADLDAARQAHDAAALREQVAFDGFDSPTLSFTPGVPIRGALTAPQVSVPSPAMRVLLAAAERAQSGRLVLTGASEEAVLVHPRGGASREVRFEPRDRFHVGDYPLVDGMVNSPSPWSAVALTRDAKRLALAGGDSFASPAPRLARSHVLLVDTESGSPTERLFGHRAIVWTAAFSEGGERLLTGDVTGKLILWDPHRGEPVANKAPEVHAQLSGRGHVGAVAALPDGRWLSAGGGGIAIWSDKMKLLEQAKAHTTSVRSLAVSLDGSLAATVGRDRRILVWRLEKGLPLLGQIDGAFLSVAIIGGRLIAIEIDESAEPEPWDPPRSYGWPERSFNKRFALFELPSLAPIARVRAEGHPQQVIACGEGERFFSVGRESDGRVVLRAHHASGEEFCAPRIHSGEAHGHVTRTSLAGGTLAALTEPAVFLFRSE